MKKTLPLPQNNGELELTMLARVTAGARLSDFGNRLFTPGAPDIASYRPKSSYLAVAFRDLDQT